VVVWQTSNLRRLRLGEEKKKERKKKKIEEETTGQNIMACPIIWGGHNNAVKLSTAVLWQY